MFQKIVVQIRQRTREEYEDLLRIKWRAARAWLQEHGEIGCAIGFGVGIFCMVFFELAVLALFLAGAAALLVWLIARSGIGPG